jgi:hypothetical protein
MVDDYKLACKLSSKLLRGTLEQTKIECGIYRKKAAGDMYTLPSSVRSKKLKQDIQSCMCHMQL